MDLAAPHRPSHTQDVAEHGAGRVRAAKTNAEYEVWVFAFRPESMIVGVGEGSGDCLRNAREVFSTYATRQQDSVQWNVPDEGRCMITLT